MTITVRLPEQTEAELRARLADSGQALSDFVREAIAEKLDREAQQTKSTPYEIWQRHFSGSRSGETDRSERAEQILKETFDVRRRRR